MPPKPSGKRSTRSRGTWTKGKSGNPAGPPRRGESWAEIIKRLGELSGDEAAQLSRDIAGKLGTLQGLTLKQAVVLRVYQQLIFEPSPGLLNAFMDRAEGAVRQAMEVTGKDGGALEVKAFDYGAAIAAITARSGADRGASGEDQSDRHGTALGEDADGG